MASLSTQPPSEEGGGPNQPGSKPTDDPSLDPNSSFPEFRTSGHGSAQSRHDLLAQIGRESDLPLLKHLYRQGISLDSDGNRAYRHARGFENYQVAGHLTTAIHFLDPESELYYKKAFPEIEQTFPHPIGEDPFDHPFVQVLTYISGVDSTLRGTADPTPSSLVVEVMHNTIADRITAPDDWASLAETLTCRSDQFERDSEALRSLRNTFLDTVILPTLAHRFVQDEGEDRLRGLKQIDVNRLWGNLLSHAAHNLFSGKDLLQMKGFADKWNKAEQQLPADFLPMRRKHEWPPNIEETHIGDGIVVESITRRQEMRYAGHSLGSWGIRGVGYLNPDGLSWSCRNRTASAVCVKKGRRPIGLIVYKAADENSDGVRVTLPSGLELTSHATGTDHQLEYGFVHKMHVRVNEMLRDGSIEFKLPRPGTSGDSGFPEKFCALENFTGISLDDTPDHTLAFFREFRCAPSESGTSEDITLLSENMDLDAPYQVFVDSLPELEEDEES